MTSYRMPQRHEVWRHWKGGHYLVLELALNVDERTYHVVYTPLYQPHQGAVVLRELSNWHDEIAPGQRRFEKFDHIALDCCSSKVLKFNTRFKAMIHHLLDDYCELGKEPPRV